MPQYPSLATPTRWLACTVSMSRRRLVFRAVVLTGSVSSAAILPEAPGLVTTDQWSGMSGRDVGALTGAGAGAVALRRAERVGRAGGGVVFWKTRFWISSP